MLKLTLVLPILALVQAQPGPDDGFQPVPYGQRPDMSELAFRTPPGVEMGCSTDIFFGDDKYLLRGVDYCGSLECDYSGGKNKTYAPLNYGSCLSVKKREERSPTDIHHPTNTIFTVHCKCPEIGHTAPPICAHSMKIFYKFIPRPVYADCVHDYGHCGGGKYCFLSKEKIECPSSCFLFTNYKESMITVQIQYQCCKMI